MAEYSLLQSITGLVLAGGRGSRMGGFDKGLQSYAGAPLVQHALERLQDQQGGALGAVFINANRNLHTYAELGRNYGAKVLPDNLPDFAGPLAGLLAGLEQCTTPYLLTVPCDSPHYPLDLALRLLRSLESTANVADTAQIAMAANANLQLQPVFSLVHVKLRHTLQNYLQQGGRQFGRWAEQEGVQVVPFNQTGDDAQAFANINTPEELHILEQQCLPARL